MEDEIDGKKRHTPQEIVAKLRQFDVLMAQGKASADAMRTIGVTEVTYYRWAAASFRAVPTQPLTFPSLIVARSDDPFATIDYAECRAQDWRSVIVIAGALLTAFLAGLTSAA